MGNKLRHEGDEVRIKVIWPDGIQKKTQQTHLDVWCMGFQTYEILMGSNTSG